MFILRNDIKTKIERQPKDKVVTNKIHDNLTFNCHISGFLRAVNSSFDSPPNFNSIIFLSCTKNNNCCMNIYI